PLLGRPLAGVRACRACHRDLDRLRGLPACGLVRPLPDGVGAREPARVPGLADLRLPRAARAPARLGAADLVGAGPDLGDERDPRIGDRRDAVARAARVRRARRALHRGRHRRARPCAHGRAGTRRALAHMNSLRVFFLGGLTSFRALFGWVSPWIYIPTLVIAPLFQILLFAYIGRTTGVGSDKFFVVGNALQYASIPCLFAMTNTIAGERYENTLAYILVSPAGRISIFLGRALPVVVNGAFVAALSLLLGGLVLSVHVPA